MSSIKVGALHRRIWKAALAVPYGKTFLLIVNSYVWRGDPTAFLRFAPISLYLKHLFLKAIIVFGVAFCTVYFGQDFGWVKSEQLDTLDTVLQVFPSVLGFGIGAYALLFSFPHRFFESLEASRQNKKLRVGAQGLNAIMAFPLLAIATVLLCAAICKVLTLPQQWLDIFGLFLLLYGMLHVMELIAVLFASARRVIRNVVTGKSGGPGPTETGEGR